MYKFILTDVKDRIGTLTINNPEESNAIDSDGYKEIIQAMDAFDKNDEVSAVIITGAGKNFSAGGNIKKFKERIDNNEISREDTIRDTAGIARAIRICGKPVIAQVNGAAAGLGLGIALACDFRIAAPSTKFVASFINVGFSGDTAIMYSLQHLLGSAKTMEILMLGEMIPGEKAMEMGMLTQLVPEEELASAALALAKKLAAKPLVALRLQKQLYYKTFFGDKFDSYIAHESADMFDCSLTDDYKEAVYAFLEKRPPNFKGK